VVVNKQNPEVRGLEKEESGESVESVVVKREESVVEPGSAAR
jgi:hypothetical protein